MVTPEAEPGRRGREKIAYFIKAGTQAELRDYLGQFCDPLLGSDVYVSRAEGDIYYITWRDLPKERILPQEYVPISKTGRGADIYAPFTRYSETKSMIIKRIREEGGGVEVAIRAFDHILEGVRGKEEQQVEAVGQRAWEILDLFQSRRLVEITPEEFGQVEKKTYAMLAAQKIDPQKLVNQKKNFMVNWLLKGETGRERVPRPGEVSLRLNWLISIGALQAAYRTALERRYGLGPVAVKFVEGREALTLARQFCRTIFAEAADRLRSQAMPSHVLFKYPERPVEKIQLNLVVGMLRTMIHELTRFIPVKPYKPVGQEVAADLEVILRLFAEERITAGKRREARWLLVGSGKKLAAQLEKYRYVYPGEKIYAPSPEYPIACDGDERRGHPYRSSEGAKGGMLRRHETSGGKDTPPETKWRAGRFH